MTPSSSWPLFGAEKALGAAYWRSDSAKQRTLDVFQLLADDDPLVFDPVRLVHVPKIFYNFSRPVSFLQFLS
jgi:hypothetical protein